MVKNSILVHLFTNLNGYGIFLMMKQLIKISIDGSDRVIWPAFVSSCFCEHPEPVKKLDFLIRFQQQLFVLKVLRVDEFQ